MKTRKTIIVVLGVGIFILITSIFTIFFLPDFIENRIYNDDNVNTETVIGKTYDNAFSLSIIRKKNSHKSAIGAEINIKDEEGETVFKCKELYRIMDLHVICWGPNTHDIWIASGDVGTFCYRYINSNWVRYSVEKPTQSGTTLNLVKEDIPESEINNYTSKINLELDDIPEEIIDYLNTIKY